MDGKKAEKHLLELATAYPEAKIEHPWGDQVVKVKGKIFCFVGPSQSGGFYFGAKLPESRDAALMFKFASPMAYNLGKSGWVSAQFAKGEDVPVPLLTEWLEESYRAVAPKTQLKLLDASRGGAAPEPKKAPPAKKKPVAKKTAAKKSATR